MRRLTPLFLIFFLAVSCGTETTQNSQSAWRVLLNEKDLTGWETYLGPIFPKDGGERGAPIGLNVDPSQVFTRMDLDGESVLRISGEHYGGISTLESFSNYHLQMQFKWGEARWFPRDSAKRDSGLLYHANGTHGADYGFWMQSQEYQIQEGDVGDYWGVAGAVFDIKASPLGDNWIYDPMGQEYEFAEESEVGRRCIKSEDFENPRGEWNTLDLYCSGDVAIHVVNGEVVMILSSSRHQVDGQWAPLTEGKIQLQSEGAEVFYKNIQIRDIEELPKYSN